MCLRNIVLLAMHHRVVCTRKHQYLKLGSMFIKMLALAISSLFVCVPTNPSTLGRNGCDWHDTAQSRFYPPDTPSRWTALICATNWRISIANAPACRSVALIPVWPKW
mmetsp:Transcript_2284/g.3303  ORF Transcript_2284/g.3303 Transcript_2284/m.3303 type:complete len:108 (-) Transcript_2284:380-703(-)